MSFEFYKVATWVLIVVVVYQVIYTYCLAGMIRENQKRISLIFSSVNNSDKRFYEERAQRKESINDLYKRLEYHANRIDKLKRY